MDSPEKLHATIWVNWSWSSIAGKTERDPRQSCMWQCVNLHYANKDPHASSCSFEVSVFWSTGTGQSADRANLKATHNCRSLILLIKNLIAACALLLNSACLSSGSFSTIFVNQGCNMRCMWVHCITVNGKAMLGLLVWYLDVAHKTLLVISWLLLSYQITVRTSISNSQCSSWIQTCSLPLAWKSQLHPLLFC